jgi:predicted CoA-binding protein
MSDDEEPPASHDHAPLDRADAELREFRDRDREGRADFEEALTLAAEDFGRDVEAESRPRRGREVRSDDELAEVYRVSRRIAVVGASESAGTLANTVPRYLQEQGFRILPVDPRGGEILGERARRSLAEIMPPVDVVSVFTPPTEAVEIVRDAVAVGAAVLWFQPGTHTGTAVRVAVEAGLPVVVGRCIGETHRELGLGPGPGGAGKPPAG